MHHALKIIADPKVSNFIGRIFIEVISLFHIHVLHENINIIIAIYGALLVIKSDNEWN